MFISLLIILQKISPLLLLIIASGLVTYLLKRKLNPNEAYLDEIKGMDKINRLTLTNTIIIFIMFFTILFNRKGILLLIPLIIIEIIRNKYILNYLNTKSKNTATRKYILYNLVFQIIVIIVVIIYYFVMEIIGQLLLLNSLNF